MKGELITVGATEVQFLLEGKDTNEQFAMFEFMVPGGAGMPLPHYHEFYDETVYGLEGVVTFTVEGQSTDIGAGDKLFIPRGAVHAFKNRYEVKSKALAIITPALIGPDFFKECSVAIKAGGPEVMPKMKAIMSKYGLVPVVEELVV